MLKAKARSWVLALCALGVPSIAVAQETRESFGSSGQLVVGAERLFGLVVASSTLEANNGGESTVTFTSFTLLANPTNGLISNYSFPRVGVDYLVTDGVSIGAAIGMFTLSGSFEAEGQADQDLETTTAFLFAPRVGYAHMFNPTLGIWPRGGVSIVASTTSGDGDETSSNQLAVTLEAPLVISPVSHVAFSVGPTIDIGVSGGNETETQVGGVKISVENDETGIDWGLMAGLLVYL
ncbi:MAG TPA: hypothetical protein VKY73_17215 [Polyangiaceae bacterium]|nr:hypothetical protein [Polyangiaceae bacterium]